MDASLRNRLAPTAISPSPLLTHCCSWFFFDAGTLHILTTPPLAPTGTPGIFLSTCFFFLRSEFCVLVYIV